MSSTMPNPEIHSKIDSVERRVNLHDQQIAQITSEMQSIKQSIERGNRAQEKTCDTMEKTRSEIVTELKAMSAVQNAMQLEAREISVTVKNDRERRVEGRDQAKWFTGLVLNAPSIILALVGIYAAFKLTH